MTLEQEKLTERIIAGAIEVHKALGPAAGLVVVPRLC